MMRAAVASTSRELHTKIKVYFNVLRVGGTSSSFSGTVVQSSDNAFGEPSTFIDPLAIDDACTRDLPFLQQLTVNTIRVYSVNSSLNHDNCMSMFSNAGIYTMWVATIITNDAC
jgi:hypothetical protein